MNWIKLQETLTAWADYLEQNTRRNLPQDYEIRNNISFDFVRDSENIYSIIFKAPEYWKYINNGRKPGKRPPLNIIENWIIKKRITPYPLANGKLPTTTSLAFLIARKIGRDGIPGKHFLEKEINSQQDDWTERIVAAITEDILRELDLFDKDKTIERIDL